MIALNFWILKQSWTSTTEVEEKKKLYYHYNSHHKVESIMDITSESTQELLNEMIDDNLYNQMNSLWIQGIKSSHSNPFNLIIQEYEKQIEINNKKQQVQEQQQQLN